MAISKHTVHLCHVFVGQVRVRGGETYFDDTTASILPPLLTGEVLKSSTRQAELNFKIQRDFHLFLSLLSRFLIKAFIYSLCGVDLPHTCAMPMICCKISDDASFEFCLYSSFFLSFFLLFYSICFFLICS